MGEKIMVELTIHYEEWSITVEEFFHDYRTKVTYRTGSADNFSLLRRELQRIYPVHCFKILPRTNYSYINDNTHLLGFNPSIYDSIAETNLIDRFILKLKKLFKSGE